MTTNLRSMPVQGTDSVISIPNLEKYDKILQRLSEKDLFQFEALKENGLMRIPVKGILFILPDSLHDETTSYGGVEDKNFKNEVADFESVKNLTKVFKQLDINDKDQVHALDTTPGPKPDLPADDKQCSEPPSGAIDREASDSKPQAVDDKGQELEPGAVNGQGLSTPQAVDDKGPEPEATAVNGQGLSTPQAVDDKGQELEPGAVNGQGLSTPQAVDDKGPEPEATAVNGPDPSKNKDEMNGLLMAGGKGSPLPFNLTITNVINLGPKSAQPAVDKQCSEPPSGPIDREASDSKPQAVDDKGPEPEATAVNGPDPSKNKDEMNGILMAGGRVKSEMHYEGQVPALDTTLGPQPDLPAVDNQGPKPPSRTTLLINTGQKRKRNDSPQQVPRKKMKMHDGGKATGPQPDLPAVDNHGYSLE